jgi:hypothetical protein
VTLNLVLRKFSPTRSACSGGTTLNTQFTIRDYLLATPLIDATVHAPNAQLPAILSLAKAYGVTALDKISGAGTVIWICVLPSPVSSLSKADIIKALNGS